MTSPDIAKFGCRFLLLANLATGDVVAAVIAVDGTACTLSNAILSANADAAIGGCTAGAGADDLVLGADVSLVTPATPVVEGSPSGLPAITSEVIIAAGAGAVIERSLAIGCSQIGISPFRLFEVSAGGDLTLLGLTLRNGCVFPPVVAWPASGGAVLVQAGGALKIEGCRLENNRAIGALATQTGLARGGAVAVLGGRLEIVDSVFVGNSVLGTDPHGGALAVESGEVVAVTASEFSGNHAGPNPGPGLGSPSFGGAISLRDTVTGTLAHLRFDANTVGLEPSASFVGPATGGGLAVEGGRVGELRDSLFVGNSAAAGPSSVPGGLPAHGGGLANTGVIEVIARTTFSGNQALGYDLGEGRGGGLDNSGWIGEIVSSTFVANTAQGGTGLHITSGPSLGGGLANVGAIGWISASTFAGNLCPQPFFTSITLGGGLYNATDGIAPDDGLRLVDTLLAGNVATNGADCYSTGTVSSLGFNLAQAPDASCVFASTGDIVGEDPLTTPPADNGCTIALPGGGCAPTVAFAANSPAVDAGLCETAGTEVDARGAVRPFDVAAVPNAAGGDGCDIGAFELDGALATVHLGLSVAESVDPVAGGSGAGNLVYTVALASLGSAAANGISVAVTLPLPTGVTLDTVTPSTGSWDGAAWTLPSLPSGGQATLTATLTAGFATSGGPDVLSLAAAVSAASGHSGELAADVERTSVNEGVFYGTFESGDTSLWSLTVGGN